MAASAYKFYNMTLLIMIFSSLLSEAYSEPSQISKMQVFAKIVLALRCQIFLQKSPS